MTRHREPLGATLVGAALVAGLLAPAAALAAGSPPAAGLDIVTTAEDTPAGGNVLTNDTDPDGDSLTVASFVGPMAGTGTLTIAANGDLNYTPPANWHGLTTATYRVSDGTLSSLGYVQITVASVNDDPVAVDDSASGTEDVDLVLAGDDLVANDTDVDLDSLSVSDVAAAAGGSVDLAAGSVTFAPDANLCGSGVGSFDYVVSDGHGGSDTGHVSVDLGCVNDPPVAVDDTALIDQASGPADYDVIANDTDVDGDALSLVSADADPSEGTAGVVGGKLRFAPLASFKGEAHVSYMVSDGNLTDEGLLTITVGPDVTAPVAATPAVALGNGRVNETAPISISWSATDAGVGVASYEVQVSVAGGAFGPVYAGSATSVTRAYPFEKGLVFRLRATDREGNTSDWVASASRKVVAYQAPGSSAISYRGTWTTVRSTASSGIGYRYVTTRGKRAQLTVTGFGIMYVAPRTSRSGYVKVYVNGYLKGRYNLHRSSTALGRVIYRATWTTSAQRTIRIVNDQGGRRTNLDAFLVLK